MYTNKEIWNVTYPIFLGLLAQNVINVTDTAFLGHVGEVALGAAAMGDIGGMFPDNDPQFLDADSLVLLRRVFERLRESGYKVINVDATIIAQRPKMKPYIPEMRMNIAAALSTSIDNISVKATTAIFFRSHAAVLPLCSISKTVYYV